MKFNPSFIQLKSTIKSANDFGASISNANPERSWLMFCPNEVYNQYIVLDDSFNNTLRTSNLIRVSLCDSNGKVINNNVGFGYKKYADYNCIFLSFKIIDDYDKQCLCLRLTWGNEGNIEGRVSALYSNLFTCSSNNKDKSSIVTYKHKEDYYGIPYSKIASFSTQVGESNMNQSNQIRLPFYFLKWKEEQDSSENTYSITTPTNINVGRVQSRDIKVWQVLGSDWINQRLSKVSYSDFVYIDGTREITRPFEWEETANGSDFSVSLLESQPVYGDEYIDEFGLVNHRPVITAINFNNGNCCTPEGDLIDPIITNQVIQSDTCTNEGIHKLITIQGHPNSTIKYRITATEIQGTSKQIRVYNSNINNSHIFDSITNAFVGYFYTNSSGIAQINMRCCLEQCSPGQVISIDANLELYQMDGVTLSGQIANIQKIKNCPVPISPVWEFISASGTSIKNARIIGMPNSNAMVRVIVTEVIKFPAPIPPLNRVLINPGLLERADVNTNDQFTISVALDPEGKSQELSLEVFSGFTMPGQNVRIVAIYYLLNINGELSDQALAVFHNQF